jgi:capsular polysaccharide biosynthesis protein
VTRLGDPPTEIDTPVEPDEGPAPRRAPAAAPPREPAGRVPLSAAILRYWWIVALFALAFAGVGAVLGGKRAPTYTAQAQLQVGSVQTTAQAVPGYVEATTSLASSYSRVATTDVVLGPAAKSLGTSAAALRGHVRVTPIPGNPLVIVTGESSSADAARRSATAVATALVSQIRTTQRAGGTSASLLSRYQAASQRAAGEEDTLATLKGKRQADPTSVSSRRLRAVRSRLDSAQLELQTLGQLYSQSRQVTTAATGIQILQQPAGASSDRSSTVQKAAFVGLVAGALVGLALAVLAAARRARRRSL